MGHTKATHLGGKVRPYKSYVSRKVIVLIVLAVLVALFYVRIKVEKVSLGYAISANKKIHKELVEENRLLQSELLKLKSPDRLERIGLHLGFKFPTQKDIIYMEKRTVIGNR